MMRARRPTAVWMKRIDSSMSLAISWSPLCRRPPGHVFSMEERPEIPAREAELLAEPLEVDQRRAQVVRDAVDEHLVLLLLLTEIIGHLAERPVHLGDLVVPRQRLLQGLPLG